MVRFVPFAGFRPVLAEGENIGDRIGHPYDAGEGRTETDPESFYVLRQTSSGRTSISVVGLLKAEKYEDGNVIPREEAPSKVRNECIARLKDTGVQSGIVSCIVPNLTDSLRMKIAESAVPMYAFTDADGTETEFLRISDIHIMSAVSAELSDQKVLLAEGTAEYEAVLNTAAENGKEGYVLASVIASDDPGLSVRPVHRLLKAGDIGENSALKMIMKNVTVTETESAEDMLGKLKDHRFGMIFKSGKCILADAEDQALAHDVYIAQSKVVNGVYKADEGKSKTVFESDIGSVAQKMADKEFDAAVVFRDPQLADIWDICASGKKMPKRSVDMIPKTLSGWIFCKN